MTVGYLDCADSSRSLATAVREGQPARIKGAQMMSGGKQAYPRTKMVLPVRLCLERSPETFAHTVDISPVGAQLGGFRISLQPGEVIILQHRHTKGRFRVIWTRQIGPTELRAGVSWVAVDKLVGVETNFWGLELPTPASSFSTWLAKFD
jgi:hypothetical protein